MFDISEIIAHSHLIPLTNLIKPFSKKSNNLILKLLTKQTGLYLSSYLKGTHTYNISSMTFFLFNRAGRQDLEVNLPF